MKNDDKKNKYDTSLWEGFAVPGTAIAYILGGAFLGFLAGRFIDDRLQSTPIATFIGLLLGLAAGAYALFRYVATLK
jgi:F0F1-type ATP synthase assembly protein I